MITDTLRLRVGTIGVRLALDLGLRDVITDIGDWLTPATLDFRNIDDKKIFMEFHEERLAQFKAGW